MLMPRSPAGSRKPPSQFSPLGQVTANFSKPWEDGESLRNNAGTWLLGAAPGGSPPLLAGEVPTPRAPEGGAHLTKCCPLSKAGQLFPLDSLPISTTVRPKLFPSGSPQDPRTPLCS